ncbi:hypothetical protein HGO97_009225 [Faecalicatena sp. AGMB00832]|uniref:DUF6449 domain-containing protein n=1 Tax=Faecalicatena faecalis TaxID=2726362 RepID=A0ABS6D3T6_9FIRM|nr:DUF6449 domain-containing protein [Faecalicatena faecalis]MBU3875995.1 hypothetical protein [Faecalicatena faecalis]
MTSKISYFKFIESDIKHRGWLAALTAAALFFLMPISLLLKIDGFRQQAVLASASGTQFLEEQIIHYTPGALNGIRFPILSLMIVILALLCAVTGFTYLHSREKQDFYHGMPIKRLQWFAISYTSGLLIFLIPYLLFGFGTIVIAGSRVSITAGFIGQCISSLTGGILGFLICYHTAILAMFLTGKTITGVLAALVLMIYGSIIPTLSIGLAQNFFDSWSENTPSFLLKAEKFCSPAALFTQTLMNTANQNLLSGIALGLIAGGVLLVAALLLCKRYPAEASENALAFPKSAPIIKYLIAVPTSLFIGLMIQFFNHSVSTNWIIIFSILSVILLCMIIEFIYHQDLTKLLSGKLSTALSLGTILIIVCVLKFDLFGYDTYLPKETKLESISFSCDQLTSYFSYPENFQPYVHQQSDKDVFSVTDYAPLYELAGEGIQNLKQGITPKNVTENDSSYGYINVTLHYKLRGGKNTYRQYAVSREAALQALTQLCKDEDYRKLLFPIFHLQTDKIVNVSLEDIYYQPITLLLDRKQQDQLLEAYKKDVLAADIPDMQYESPLGELSLGFPGTHLAESVNTVEADLTQIDRFYIYRSYQNTLDKLEEYGYPLRTEIDPKDVMFMTYYPNEHSEADNYARAEITDYNFGEGISITEPEEIKEMLGRIGYDQCNGIFDGRITAVGSVEITLTGKSYPNTYVVTK